MNPSSYDRPTPRLTHRIHHASRHSPALEPSSIWCIMRLHIYHYLSLTTISIFFALASWHPIVSDAFRPYFVSTFLYYFNISAFYYTLLYLRINLYKLIHTFFIVANFFPILVNFVHLTNPVILGTDIYLFNSTSKTPPLFELESVPPNESYSDTGTILLRKRTPDRATITMTSLPQLPSKDFIHTQLSPLTDTSTLRRRLKVGLSINAQAESPYFTLFSAGRFSIQIVHKGLLVTYPRSTAAGDTIADFIPESGDDLFLNLLCTITFESPYINLSINGITRQYTLIDDVTTISVGPGALATDQKGSMQLLNYIIEYSQTTQTRDQRLPPLIRYAMQKVLA